MPTLEATRLRVVIDAWAAFDKVLLFEEWDSVALAYVARDFTGFTAFKCSMRVNPTDASPVATGVVTIAPNELPTAGKLRLFISATESGKLQTVSGRGRVHISIVGDDAQAVTRFVAAGKALVRAGVTTEAD